MSKVTAEWARLGSSGVRPASISIGDLLRMYVGESVDGTVLLILRGSEALCR